MKHPFDNFVIETKRLFLRPVLVNDYSDFIIIHNNANVRLFIGNGKHNWTVEEFDTEIKNHTKDYNEGYGFWTTVEKGSNKICGKCGIIEHIKDGNIELELGYLFGEEFWGRGYATEVSLAIAEYFFCKLGKKQLVAYTFLENTNSIRVLEKNGMLKEYEFNVKGHQIVRFALNRDTYFKR